MAVLEIDLEDTATPKISTVDDAMMALGLTADRVSSRSRNFTTAMRAQATATRETGQATRSLALDTAESFDSVFDAGNKLHKQLSGLDDKWVSIVQNLGTFREQAGGTVTRLAAANPVLTGMAAAVGSIGTALAATGRTVSADGKSIESNLTRVTRAVLSLKNISVEAPSWMQSAWKSIDQSVSSSTKNVLDNIQLIRSSLSSISPRLLDQREQYKALGEANAKLGEAAKQRARDEQIASIQTMEALDREQAAVRETALEAVRAGTFKGDAEKRYTEDMQKLAQRRTEVAKEQAAKRTEAERKATEEAAQYQKQAHEEELARIREAADARANAIERIGELIERQTRFERDLQFDAQDEVLKNIINALEIEGRQEDVIHAAKLRQIRLETDRKVEAAKTAEEAQTALHDGERRRLREEGDFQRAEMKRQADARREKAEKEIEIERAKRERLKQLGDQLAEATGVDGKALLQRADPRATLKALQDKRRDAAQRAFFNENREGVDFQDPEAVKRLRARTVAAGNRAAEGAFRDFRAGRVDGAELAQAQNQAAQGQIKALAAQGRLSADTTAALQQMVQAAAENQAATAALQQQVQALSMQAKALSGDARATRQRAQRNSL